MSSVKLGAKRPALGQSSASKLGSTKVGTKFKTQVMSSSLGDTEELNEAQLTELVTLLRQHREILAEKIKIKRNATASADQGSGDEVDQATQNEETLLEIELMERDVALLIEIDAALDRVSEGSYGICEGTDEPIGYQRLKHKPWARYSITHQEELERNAKRSYNRG